MDTPKVLLIVTQDTKEEECRFMRQTLEAAGCEVIHMDPSIRRTVGGAEIGPAAIAGAAGKTIEEVRALGHEGKCQAVMIEGALKLAADIAPELAGVISIGGSMGTGLSTAIMRALPYGLPKLMVSTMASGFTKPYVGVKDIAMMNAVTDIAGLNSISRDVFRNAALAMAGMAKGYDPARGTEKPLVLITTLGTTEKCTRRIREALEADGAEVMVFHSSGAGGPTLDSIAAEREVAVVLDLSLTEIVDHLNGGIADAGPDRAKAALARGIPTIFAPGNVDFIIAGPLDVAEQQFPGRRYHVHNPALTAVRTRTDDLETLADHMAELAREAKGPVRWFTPLKGFSHHDSPEGHLLDLAVPGPFAEYLASVMPEGVEVEAVDAHFNDPEFADRIAAAAREYLKAPAAA
ncbi:MAG: Tm-1-like ATP-binding domain-containing protein [Sphingomonadaceae bacterium]|nr:Tm-1-like ATP-binding domain-containing protein [Sphingomonadaceae bacterium]